MGNESIDAVFLLALFSSLRLHVASMKRLSKITKKNKEFRETILMELT